MEMITEEQMIEKRLRELEVEIAVTLLRLPAHSVKPPVMIDLLTLEDERDMLFKKLSENQLMNKVPGPSVHKVLVEARCG